MKSSCYFHLRRLILLLPLFITACEFTSTFEPEPADLFALAAAESTAELTDLQNQSQRTSENVNNNLILTAALVEGVSIQLEGGVTGSFFADFKVRSSGEASGEILIRTSGYSEEYVVREGRLVCQDEQPVAVVLIGKLVVTELGGASFKSTFQAEVRPGTASEQSVLFELKGSGISERRVEAEGILRFASSACQRENPLIASLEVSPQRTQLNGSTVLFSADVDVFDSGDASGEMTIRGIDFTEKYVILEGRPDCGTEAPAPITIVGYSIEESDGTSTKLDFTAVVRPSEGGTGVIIDFNTSDSDKHVEVDGVLRVTSEACDDPQ